jgi:hypothetical protein
VVFIFGSDFAKLSLGSAIHQCALNKHGKTETKTQTTTNTIATNQSKLSFVFVNSQCVIFHVMEV